MDTIEIANEEIPVYRPSWEQIVRGVVKVKLHICAWSGKKKLDMADLGLHQLSDEQKRAVEENILTLGHKRLLPHEYSKEIKRVESQARRLLEAYSYQTELGHLVPRDRYYDLKEAVKSLQSEFYTIRDKITSPEVYTRNLDTLKGCYNKLASTTWQIITQGTAAQGTPDAPQEFAQEFTERIIAQIPSPEEIKDKFLFDWTPAYIQQSLEYEAGIDEAQNEAWQLAQLDREIRGKATKEREEKIEGTINTFATYLRNLLYEASTDILEGIQKNGALVGSQAKRLRNIINEVSRLNFTNDEEIEAIRLRLEDSLGDSREDRNIAEIGQVLRQICTVTRAELVALDNIPRSARHLDIPDTVDLGAYRQARENLLNPGITEDNISPESRQSRQLSLI